MTPVRHGATSSSVQRSWACPWEGVFAPFSLSFWVGLVWFGLVWSVCVLLLSPSSAAALAFCGCSVWWCSPRSELRLPLRFAFCVCAPCHSVYAWSVFVQPIADARPNWESGAAVQAFSVFIWFLGLSSAVAGKRLPTLGPRLCGLFGAVLNVCGVGIMALCVYCNIMTGLWIGAVFFGIGLGTACAWSPARAAVQFVAILSVCVLCALTLPLLLPGSSLP